jgi:hypothetical protein
MPSRPTITTRSELVALVESSGADLYVRFARDGEVAEPSVDHESGLTLPGVAVNPLRAPRWWKDHTTEEWVARQIGTYSHLQQGEPERTCWIVRGEVIDRGPDNEPLLTDVEVVASVTAELVEKCVSRTGQDREGREGPKWQQSA